MPVLCPQIKLQATLDIIATPQEAYDAVSAFLPQHPQIDTLFITCGRVVDICRAVRDQNRKMKIVCFERYNEISLQIKSQAPNGT